MTCIEEDCEREALLCEEHFWGAIAFQAGQAWIRAFLWGGVVGTAVGAFFAS